jgi:hypothetical protein
MGLKYRTNEKVMISRDETGIYDPTGSFYEVIYDSKNDSYACYQYFSEVHRLGASAKKTGARMYALGASAKKTSSAIYYSTSILRVAYLSHTHGIVGVALSGTYRVKRVEK